jgi:hypothetical protein
MEIDPCVPFWSPNELLFVNIHGISPFDGQTDSVTAIARCLNKVFNDRRVGVVFSRNGLVSRFNSVTSICHDKMVCHLTPAL